MAITMIDYMMLTQIKKLGLLPANPAVLEIGEQNWYGDLSVEQLASDIRSNVSDAAKQQALLQRLDALCSQQPPNVLFDIAKVFYEAFWAPRLLESIDLSGTEVSMRFDLNEPVPLEKTYDVLVNLGTAEHVFNVYQFFKTIHELCASDGLMVHTMPFGGWVDHGFYNFQPTFYFDLALANNYTVHILAYTELKPAKIHFCQERGDIVKLAQQGGLGANSALYAVLRKPKTAAPFQVPMQGYYAGNLSESGAQAWKTLR